MIVLIVIFLVIVSILLSLIGFKFRKKKWLRLIAGNTFNDNAKSAGDIAPFVGILMYVLSAFILVTAIVTLYLSK